MASDRTVAAGFDMAAERSGSATAGSTPDRQRPFVSDQDRLSLGFVAFLFWTVENGVYTFVAGVYKGSGRRYWIDSPSGNAASTDGLQRRRLA